MLSVEEARSRILAAFSPLPAEVIALTDGLGRVLAADLVARTTQPPKAVSAMDGYAVRAADVARAPVSLSVVGEVPAGQHHAGRLEAGQAVRIYTGAPLPEGADAIVIQEDTRRDGDVVTVEAEVKEATYVRRAGLDFRAGVDRLPAGRRLTARDLGLAAAMDRPWLPVRRRPRVAILATGDEVVLPGEPRGENQIVSSNGFALSAFVEACGGAALNLGVAPDDTKALADRLAGAAGCDLLLTAGGASVGKHDLVQEVLGELGVELDFWKVAMRPGKPLMFGRLGPTPVLGLPGNPVSCMVCATLLVWPAIEVMLGRGDTAPPQEIARLGRDLPANDRRQDYLRARLAVDSSGQRVATPFDAQDSSMLSRLAAADCLVVRPPHAPPAAAGDPVQIVPLTGGCLQV